MGEEHVTAPQGGAAKGSQLTDSRDLRPGTFTPRRAYPIMVHASRFGLKSVSRCKENLMGRKLLAGGALAWVLLVVPITLAKPSPASKNGPGTIVIVFKDGHRQTFNLADIERVEFPAVTIAGADAGAVTTPAPPRGHFVGKWEVGDGSGGKFFINLKESGEADRTLHADHGRWTYVNGEVHVTWNDGAMDAIRKVGAHYQKFAYEKGKSFDDTPDNVGEARLVTEKPI